MRKLIYLLFTVMLVSGCTTIPEVPTLPNNGYRWWANGWGIKSYEYNNYEFEIISDPHGAKIEWNNDYIGTTPIRQVYNGRLDDSITVKAYPIFPGQQMQIKYLDCHQPLPRKIYFDMNLVRTAPSLDVNINQ